MIFDTHAHYDDAQFDSDREELLAAMHRDRVGTILNVGASLSGCRRSVELADTHDYIYAAVGVHPDEVGTLNDETWGWLTDLAKNNPKVVAIGEIGLDYHWNVEDRELQKDWFVRQMELAGEMGLPICVHSRDAAADTLELVGRYGKNRRGVIHCFSYSPEIARAYVKLGYDIGLGGVVTFKNAKKAREVVRAVPLERILLETDAPYLAPVPHRGKRNQSSYLGYVAEEIAAIKGITAEEVIACTEGNARRLFLAQA